MTAQEELERFVRAGLGRGVSRVRIEEVLIQVGWDQREVADALARFAEIDFPVPVPVSVPRAYLSAREAFLYLVVFSTLYMSVYHFGRLVFGVIELAFPDPAVPAMAVQFIHERMRWSVATLIIAFPVFLSVSRLTERAVQRDPGKRRSKVRRWLTYLTLFLTASALIGNGITFVHGVLGGELTVRFVLKITTVAVIAGVVFGYYLGEMRHDEDTAERGA